MKCSDLDKRGDLNQSEYCSHTITVAKRWILTSLSPFIYMALHLYLLRNSFYLPFKQPECHFIIKQRCQGRREYYLKCKQSVKDDCQETAHSERLTATAAATTKCLQELKSTQACGVHQNTWRPSYSTARWAPPPEGLIRQVWDEVRELKFPGVLLTPNTLWERWWTALSPSRWQC